MWPILCRVSPSALLRLFSGREIWYHLLFSLVVNWILAPLLMLGLAWAFLPDKEGLREGLILVGIARCIAMVKSPSRWRKWAPAHLPIYYKVLVWTDIADGDADCEPAEHGSFEGDGADSPTTSVCAVLVAFNSVLQIVLYAPLALLYVNTISSSSSAVVVSYATVARSVAAFLGSFRAVVRPQTPD